MGDALSWTTEQVDGYPDNQGLDPGIRGEFCSMKITPAGQVWISYYDRNNGALRVSHRPSGSGWGEPELVDPGSGMVPNTGMFTSLALDEASNPVIAYHDENKGTLQVAHHDGTAWTVETAHTGEAFSGVDEAGEPLELEADVGEFANLYIDGNTEYIAFYDRAHGDLHLLEGFAGSYTHTVVSTEGDVGQWPNIWTDGSTLLIAAHDVGNQDLVLFTRTGGGSFTKQIVDSGEYRGADSDVFMKDGQAAVVYFDGHENNMMLATTDGSAWTLETLAGDDGALGFFNESVMVNDAIWVASYDYTNRQIWAKQLE